MDRFKAILLITSTCLTTTLYAKQQVVCVFDPIGKSGDAFALAKDYALEAKNWGADLSLKAYIDERVAAEDLKVGKCDGAIISGLRGRQFNKYTGSLDAVGALTNMKTAINAYKLLSSPMAEKIMVVGPYEIAGLGTIGPAYLFVNDRSINTLAKAAGKKIGVFKYDEAQPKLVQHVGGQAVSVDVTNAGAKFNNHEIDIVPAPIVAFKPFELYKGLGEKGAIVRFPLTQISANFIIRKDQFPAGFGQKSRTWVASQLNRTFGIIAKYESDIPSKYWMDIPKNEQLNYMKMMREARIQLTKAGIYDPKMMNFLKKVRCKENPSNFECALNDE
ncbi:putative multidrug efflux protein AdeT1 [Acinetobacter baumannii]|uniref:putative multidrug efflux protein AdeT1 n=1 Tax=Acinetobacter baumannii TaxID=470 RepID=UPI003AF5A27D